MFYARGALLETGGRKISQATIFWHCSFYKTLIGASPSEPHHVRSAGKSVILLDCLLDCLYVCPNPLCG